VPFIHPEYGNNLPEGFSDVKAVIVKPAKNETKGRKKDNKNGFPHAEYNKKKRQHKSGNNSGNAPYIKKN